MKETIKMPGFTRLLLMYTNINLCGVGVYPWLSPVVKDVVRASTLLILVAVARVWLSGDAGSIYAELFNSFALSGNAEVADVLPTRIKQLCVIVFDVLFHIVPLVAVGVPKSPAALCIAVGLLLTWYAFTRNRIGEIYAPSVPADESIAFAAVTGLSFAAWLGFIQTQPSGTPSCSF